MIDRCEQCPHVLCREGKIKALYCLLMREPHRCLDCRFCDAQNLVCYPESEDCLPMYELEEEDLAKPGFCDFFKPIEGG